MLIKIGIRHNLIYLLMLIIINLVKLTLLKIIYKYLYYDDSHLTLFMMFLSEFIAGLLLYKYKYKAKLCTKDSNRQYYTFMGIKLIKSSGKLKRSDSTLKIYFLFFTISFFDFYDTILNSYYMPHLDESISSSLGDRLQGILAITTGLLSSFLLKFRMYRHQKCSLVTISICLLIIIISEYCLLIFTNRMSKINNFSYNLLFIFLDNFFWAMVDVVEKYLLEFNFVNHFQMLMYEGAFGLIMSSIYLFFIGDIFKEFREIYYDKNKLDQNTQKFIILIIALLFYYFLLGALNSYRVVANKLYSPTSIALVYYIFCPYYIITSYFEDDFKINGKQNFLYFFFNLIIIIILVFCGCIYNELFVLFCCNLEYDTHSQISNRATIESLKDREEELLNTNKIN